VQIISNCTKILIVSRGMRKVRSLHERIIEAETLASQHLGNANAAREKGLWERVPRLERLAQKWLDEANRLRSMGDYSWQSKPRATKDDMPSAKPFETWDDLARALREELGKWHLATAWAVASGDPDGCDIRMRGGRVSYEAAWVVLGPKGGEYVRLSRLDSDEVGPREVVRWVKPDDLVEVRRMTPPKSNDSVFMDTT
jgi:hypothetical protein